MSISSTLFIHVLNGEREAVMAGNDAGGEAASEVEMAPYLMIEVGEIGLSGLHFTYYFERLLEGKM